MVCDRCNEADIGIFIGELSKCSKHVVKSHMQWSMCIYMTELVRQMARLTGAEHMSLNNYYDVVFTNINNAQELANRCSYSTFD